MKVCFYCNTKKKTNAYWYPRGLTYLCRSCNRKSKLHWIKSFLLGV